MQVPEEPDVNAFCMAGGKMAIYTGLIDKVRPADAELIRVGVTLLVARVLTRKTETASPPGFGGKAVGTGYIRPPGNSGPRVSSAGSSAERSRCCATR